MQPHNEKKQNNKICHVNCCHNLFSRSTLNNSGNNYIFNKNEKTPYRMLIVTVSADDKCYIINYDNISNILLNNAPLAESKQMELLHGDRLCINNYQLQISQLQQSNAIPQSCEREVQATELTDIKDEKYNKNLIEDKIWDTLLEEFPMPFSASSPLVDVSENNKIMQPSPELPTDKPGENLAGHIHVQQRTSDPMALFDNSTVFEYENLLADTTPSVLLAEDNQQLQHSIAPPHTPKNNSFEEHMIPKIMDTIQPEKKPSVALNNKDIYQNRTPIIISHALQSLNPITLIEEVRSTRSISRWPLPYYRKAILWDHFVKSYHQLIVDTKSGHLSELIQASQPTQNMTDQI
ncbi:hypothetical protein ACTZGB_09780 [Yersinia bercovieri]|uniref:hypothetical protein n=1 Tax=Yersinia bercovieri TaxID=634 RepID=UPI003FD829F9